MGKAGRNGEKSTDGLWIGMIRILSSDGKARDSCLIGGKCL